MSTLCRVSGILEVPRTVSRTTSPSSPCLPFPPGCWGRGGPYWEGWVQLLQPRPSSSPGMRPLNGGAQSPLSKRTGGGGGDPAWPAFGTRRQDAVSNSPRGSGGRCYYFSVLAGMGGELRKVKWAGQGHTVSVCQKWGSRSGVFNRLFWGYLRGPWPPVFL